MTYPRSPVARSYFIHTFGCQMNESDSQRMGEALARAGWRPVGTPDGADLVLVNTCAIREKAEDKLYSALGRYRLLKAQRGTRIGVAGCVAQQEKKRLLSRAPFVDFVLGPDHLEKVPELVDTGGVETDFVDTEHYLFPQADPETSRGKTTAFVTAMKGCDNVCSFCVVPYTRGREVSRSYAEIVGEVASLVAVGVREITLIGQNVNSYAGGCTFAGLIRRVAAVPGLLRIRFTTSHPMDLSDDLVRCFAEVPQLMPHFHLPVQHGADSVLERMRRRYTIAEYERRIAALPAHVALTSDIICGFPGETDDEHRQNVEFLRRTGYDNLFSFIYSPRPHTGAILKLREWGEVPRGVAIRRLEEVQALQMERTLRRHRARVGAIVEVLVEEPGFGRSRENWTVHFNGEAGTGDLVNVRVESASLVALRGVQIDVIDRALRVELPARRRLAVVSA
ncbi:MAG: tRNA (N6-isopentenyl adenosine(37)-C2)-methylthiotransferase MiaB [Deltaproteobacteria bacterium]|nr:MAG: tRNA (N6-isopentenyl adenosine(37)-C2)-methylthiotransferase MiaB [Deltaproteobacteria bacterium]TMB37570.1 MAG: tRNA (N6-isopentenyl adenosine(37)-C2)-methylthiotransferase MiaB [Deltaproteobacteria bacterium]